MLLYRFCIELFRGEYFTPLDMTKIVQTKIPTEVDDIITALAKTQMVSKAAVVRQLLVKAVFKAREQEGQL